MFCLSFSFKRKVSNESSERIISLKPLLKQKYTELGETTWAQYCTGIIFVILVFLWITKDLHFTSGWGSLFLEE
jgi:di/tricarboxylate transporter